MGTRRPPSTPFLSKPREEAVLLLPLLYALLHPRADLRDGSVWAAAPPPLPQPEPRKMEPGACSISGSLQHLRSQVGNEEDPFPLDFQLTLLVSFGEEAVSGIWSSPYTHAPSLIPWGLWEMWPPPVKSYPSSYLCSVPLLPPGMGHAPPWLLPRCVAQPPPDLDLT